PGHMERVLERIGADSIIDPELRRIFSAMIEHGADAGPELLAEHLDGDAVVVMQELLEEPNGLDHADEGVGASLGALHERGLTRRMEEIDGLMPIADVTEKDALLDEKVRIVQELRSLGTGRWKQFQ
ncbi:MAG: hypothetical protein H0W68_11875, partial [Gemmatimonadaceae bacterium]|nr:hypothetical protein [Gemmatimonadaceae bacterium]